MSDGGSGFDEEEGNGPLSMPRLRSLVARSERESESGDTSGTAGGRRRRMDPPRPHVPGCDLCAEPLSSRHRHLVELDEHSLLCACRACSLLFDREAAGGDHYRLVPDRVRVLEDFRLREQDWSALGIPVELAFFFRSSDLERIVAFYPGPMGATESQLGLDRWERLESENPALRRLEDDVEALLVDRRDEERPEGWIVPIDECYRLAGLMRQHWKGLAGGTEVWDRIEEFFENLQRRAGRRSA